MPKKNFTNYFTPQFNWFSRQINRKEQIDYDWILIFCLILLTTLGLAFLASSLSASSNFYSEFFRQLILGIWLGGGGCFLLAKTDYHVVLKWSKPLIWLTLGMLLFLAVFIVYAVVFMDGDTATNKRLLVQSVRFLPIRPRFANGAIRWIRFSFLPDFQPAELAKLTVLLFFANFFQNLEIQKKTAGWWELKRPLYLFFTVCCLIIIQPDLGSVVLLTLIILASMWVANVHWKILATIASVGLLVTVIMIALTSYRVDRVRTFLAFATTPETVCTGPEGSTTFFQVCQARKYITEGGLWGKGYGNGQSKQLNAAGKTYVPEIASDAILTLIAEETGFVGTLFFISLYFVIFLRGLRIARQAPDIAGKTIATGIITWIVAQAFINMAGITGMIPLKGIPLPFVSSGGSALVLNLLSMGILINISKKEVNQDLTNL